MLPLTLPAYAEEGTSQPQDKVIQPQTEIATRATIDHAGTSTGGYGLGFRGGRGMFNFNRGSGLNDAKDPNGRTYGNTLGHVETAKIQANNATGVETSANVSKAFQIDRTTSRLENNRQKENEKERDRGESVLERLERVLNRINR